MTIACLGWGSLCWNPGRLPIDGEWQQDGPTLPLEFARVSEGGRITLVITDTGALLPVLWVPLAVATLENAVSVLAARESVTSLNSIGRVPACNRAYPFEDAISAWAKHRGLSGVVWTALKSGLIGDRSRVPTLEELRRHIDRLSPERRADALKYVERAPAQIQTNYRAQLQAALAGVD